MTDSSRLRLVVLRVVVVSILLTLLGRLAYLQLAEGATYSAKAGDNRIRQVITPAARGQILDDRGVPLVSNRTALVVSVTRSIVRSQPKKGAAVLERLAAVVGIPALQIARTITPCGEKQPDGTIANKDSGCWNGSPLQAVPIVSYRADDSTQVRKVLAIEEHAEDFPGIQAKYAAVREYPQGAIAAHSLGYIGSLTGDDLLSDPSLKALASGSLIGKSGVEQVYDAQLRGVDGVQRLLVDKDATVTGTLGTVEAQAGDNLVLSLDSSLQRVAEKALADGVAAARARYDKGRGKNFTAPNGAAIVVDVRNGQVVALANFPSYDPALFVPRISTADYTALLNAPGKPLLATATQGQYAPGSTFKISSTAAAVAAGNPLYGTYPCTSSFTAGRTFRNFEGETFGNIDLRKTLVKSCDTVYYRLAFNEWKNDGGTKNTGRAREIFAKTARAFGFGTDTGIDLPSESNGSVTDRASKTKDYESLKKAKCDRAKNGYPEEPDPGRAAYLKALAVEYCADGFTYKGGDAILFSIGQGDVLSTPMQLTMAYAALANGGTVFEPRVAKGFLSADGTTFSKVAPAVKGTLGVPAEVLDYMRSSLVGVPQPGGTAQTAFRGFPFGQLSVAGKTGTADVDPVRKAPTSWFASFAPASAPKYAVVVMVAEAGTGGTTAAPITRKIYDAMYGFSGQKRLLDANGDLPSALPVVQPDGTIGRPGTPTKAVEVPLGGTASAAPAPTSSSGSALGGPPGLPWGEPVRPTSFRRTVGAP